MSIPITLTIAGSDSGGGAGIQADIKTLSALGTYATSVITALTAQNTQEVRDIHELRLDFVAQQMDAVCSDMQVDAVKIGMLATADMIAVVRAGLDRHNLHTVVLDPVMVAKSGDKLLADNAVDALRRELVPRATLITPNLPEAAVLLGQPEATTSTEVAAQGKALLELGAAAVLMKGGHAKGDEIVDLLLTPSGSHEYRHRRVNTNNTHGTGCTLSSAITAGLAHGRSLFEAVDHATDYVHAAIVQAETLAVGKGHGPVHHFHALWTNKAD